MGSQRCVGAPGEPAIRPQDLEKFNREVRLDEARMGLLPAIHGSVIRIPRDQYGWSNTQLTCYGKVAYTSPGQYNWQVSTFGYPKGLDSRHIRNPVGTGFMEVSKCNDYFPLVVGFCLRPGFCSELGLLALAG
jgi:hypothetical protein